ncbi:MAG: hypothetical protein ACK4ZJ_16565 [Allorhizobium sp.]
MACEKVSASRSTPLLPRAECRAEPPPRTSCLPLTCCCCCCCCCC